MRPLAVALSPTLCATGPSGVAATSALLAARRGRPRALLGNATTPILPVAQLRRRTIPRRTASAIEPLSGDRRAAGRQPSERRLLSHQSAPVLCRPRGDRAWA